MSEFMYLPWPCSSAKFPITILEPLLSLSLMFAFIMKFQPFELIFSLMQKNLGNSLVFTEVYSQVNAINTFSNANDLIYFFKKYVTKIVALKKSDDA